MIYFNEFTIYHEGDASVGIPGESLMVRLPDLSHQMSSNDAAKHSAYLLETLRAAAQEVWEFPTRINPYPLCSPGFNSVYDQYRDLYEQPAGRSGSSK